MLLNFENLSTKISFVTLKTNKIRDTFDKNLRIASVSSKMLNSIVEDVLDFAKIEAGMFSLNLEKFKIIDLIEDIKYIFEYQ